MDQLEVQEHQPHMKKSLSYLSMLRTDNFGPINVRKLSPESR
jgi:hypothetical protein